MMLEKIKILGHEYAVQIRDSYIAHSGGNTGECNNYLNIISVGKELPVSGQAEVLLHEIIEAINYRLELGLEHSKICVLGEVLHQVLRDNKLNFNA